MKFPIHRHVAVPGDGQLVEMVSVRDLVVCVINLQGK